MASKRVLLADDNEDTRVICRHLLMWHGYSVEEARTGPEAVSAANAAPPDLLILDLQLPELSGLEVVRLLRSADKTAGIPILVYTADVVGVTKPLVAGVTSVLIKPCATERMLQEVQRIIGAPAR